jgi:hypothetical protein
VRRARSSSIMPARSRASSLSEQPILQGSVVEVLKTQARWVVEESVDTACFHLGTYSKARGASYIVKREAGISQGLLEPGRLSQASDGPCLQPQRPRVDLTQVQWGEAETNVLHMQSKHALMPTVQHVLGGSDSASARMSTLMSRTDVTKPMFQSMSMNAPMPCIVNTSRGVVVCLRIEC